jgi:hypothetical protein
MGSGAMTYIPSFIKIGSGIQNLLVEEMESNITGRNQRSRFKGMKGQKCHEQ